MKNDRANGSRRAFLGFLAKAPFIPGAILAARAAPPTPPPAIRQVLMDDFFIAGFQYYDGVTELPSLAAGTRLTLRPEPTNRYDSLAVEIFHGPVKLGYVPRVCNRHISRLLLDAIPLVCDVEQADRAAPTWEAVAVRVWLPTASPGRPR